MFLFFLLFFFLSLSLFFFFGSLARIVANAGRCPLVSLKLSLSLHGNKILPRTGEGQPRKQFSNNLFQMTGDYPVERGSAVFGCFRRELGMQTSGASAPRPAAQGSSILGKPPPRPLFQLRSPRGL